METSPPTRGKFACLIGSGQASTLESWRAVVTECLPPNRDLVVMARGSERALRIAASLYALDNPTEDRFERTVAIVRHLRARRNAALVVVLETRPRGFATQLEQVGVHVVVEPPHDPAQLPVVIASALEIHHNAEENPVVMDLEETPLQWTPKQTQATKLEYTMLIGLDHFAGMITLLAGIALGAKKQLRFLYFRKSSELLALAESQAFNCAFMYLGNIQWDRNSEDGSFLGAAGLLTELHARHKKQIVVSQGWDLESEYAGTGVSFLPTPLALEGLQRCLPELNVNFSDQSQAGRKSFEVAVVGSGCGLETMFLSMPLQELLGPEYRVELHYYQKVNDWEAAVQSPDLVVLYLNPELRDANGDEVLPFEALKEIRAKGQMPVLFLTNEGRYGLEYAGDFSAAGAAGTFCFLPPFPTPAFVEVLRDCIHCSLRLRAQQNKNL
jgi:hypothetical protein